MEHGGGWQVGSKVPLYFGRCMDPVCQEEINDLSLSPAQMAHRTLIYSLRRTGWMNGVIIKLQRINQESNKNFRIITRLQAAFLKIISLDRWCTTKKWTICTKALRITTKSEIYVLMIVIPWQMKSEAQRVIEPLSMVSWQCLNA